MNYHRENIFTDQSVSWRLKIYARKEQLLEVDIVSMEGLLLRTIWFLYLRDNPAVELMILVAAIWKVKGKLTTDLNVKPTDRHHYLHYTSAHPNHTKRSVVYSRTLRLSRICSYKMILKNILGRWSHGSRLGVILII